MAANFAEDPSINELVLESGLSRSTIRRYIAQGRLRAYKVGPRLIRIERSSLSGLTRPVTSVIENLGERA